ncbi:putative nuclease HARBI1 [Oryzias melastigma]|uniref:Putative nuclease HARBI1 n=1 Tax=Oryzias melastigma TaxID=30732 RepID=A0A3B3DGD8_ORYME|nr:putative nuclease HARBI1 [Oryzias melastigma]
MENDEQLRSMMFLLTYVLLKRRRDINNVSIHTRHEIQRRIRHRQYFLQRQRRMLMMLIAEGIHSSVRIRTRPWTTTPSSDWWERVVMTEFQPSDWLDKFRMSRETFFYLCDKLRPRLARQDTSFRLALPVEKRVAVALWRLASNIEYRTISTLFGVGKSTVCRCVRDMCHAIVALLSCTYLKPPNEEELEDSARLFRSYWGFPHCVAAIATLHTAIITPSNNASDYANPAGWLSVLSQVAVSGRGHFWDVCASFPGGTDPAEILQNSSLWATATEGGLSPAQPPLFMGKAIRYVMLGEACYPLQSWLMKAYPEERSRRRSHAALTERQQVFNQQLHRALRVSEEALLRLRARWQCLSKRNDCRLDVVPTMILACCILHNMCESHGDAFKTEWQVEVAETESPQPDHRPLTSTSVDERNSEEVRDLFCDYFEQQSNDFTQ